MLGKALSAEINWTWFFSFLGAAATLTIVTLVFSSTVASVLKGKDGRTSTSKTQVVLWTYGVVFALLTLLVGFVIVEVGHAVSNSPDFGDAELGNHVADKFRDFVEKGMDPAYYVLLGLPLTAAISAKAITTTKTANGSVVKPNKEDVPDDQQTNRVAEIVTDDDASGDLGDYQYFLFNLVAFGYFLSQFLIHPADGLPNMPDTLVALTGVSAAAYVAKKGVYTDPPILMSVSPLEGEPGDRVELFGSKLLRTPPTPQAATVQFGRSVARPLPADGNTELEPDHLWVKVPAHLSPGPTTVKVVRPPGAASQELPFEVIRRQPKVESVVPSAFRKGAELTISGTGFVDEEAGATAQKAVTVGGHRCETAEDAWTAGRVVVTVPADAPLRAGTHPLVVYDSKGRPSEAHTVEVVG